MNSQLYVVEETAVPSENHRLTPSHWQLSHMVALISIVNGNETNSRVVYALIPQCL